MHCQHQKKALTLKQAEKPKKCSRKQPLLEGLQNKKPHALVSLNWW